MEDPRKTLGARYKKLVGYDPFEDDPSIAVEEVRETLTELERLHASEDSSE